MGSVTDNSPKCLTKLRGRELVSYQIDALRAGGVDKIALVTGFMGEALVEFGDFQFHNPEWASTNMVASLILAKNWLREAVCVVSYSDIFYEPHVVRELLNSEGDVAVSYDPNWLDHWSKRFVDPLSDAESFKVDSEGKLLDIGRKVGSVSEIEGQYMGLVRFTPPSWREVERTLESIGSERCRTIQMTDVIQAVVLENRLRVQTVQYIGNWGEIDSESDLHLYEQLDTHENPHPENCP
jgi:choline kinase